MKKIILTVSVALTAFCFLSAILLFISEVILITWDVYLFSELDLLNKIIPTLLMSAIFFWLIVGLLFYIDDDL